MLSLCQTASKLAGANRKVSSVYYYKRSNKFAVKVDGKEVFQAVQVRPIL